MYIIEDLEVIGILKDKTNDIEGFRLF